jgi:reversibly glycosylated polypeptide/UDP-arabinopyranose mutase
MKNQKIVVVIPTIRPESLSDFFDGWYEQFSRYNVGIITVYDGEKPKAEHTPCVLFGDPQMYSLKEIMGKEVDLISNYNASVRNLGFVLAKQLGYDIVITLDDDTRPDGDTIGDHLKALAQDVPVSWINTAIVNNKYTDYMRGFPYEIRQERPVMLSHGVWKGVPDRDAPTQLIAGAHTPVDFYKGPIPKGVLFPFCGMNVAFRISALPYIYYAPVGQFKGAERFDDIWGGIPMKKDFDTNGWAIVSGFASVKHERASDPFKNLEREVIGIKENEDFWKGESKHVFFKEFEKKRDRWQKFIIIQDEMDLF